MLNASSLLLYHAFQPTRPLRGATHNSAEDHERNYISTHAPLAGRDILKEDNILWTSNFNPRAPCGARRRRAPSAYAGRAISTHAPLAGRDKKIFAPYRFIKTISTHAPLAGRDAAGRAPQPQAQHFNPRAPCGARQQKCTNHYAHFCDNRQISDAFAQNAACQGILLLFDAGKPCGFWVRTAQVISARLCFAL